MTILNFGAVNGVAIAGHAPAGRAGLDALKLVRLSVDYDRDPAPHFPRPDAGAPLPSVYVGRQTISAGTMLTLYAAEADALIAAGAATYS